MRLDWKTFRLKRLRLEACVFWLLVLLHLLPIWLYRFIPTQDGPSHVANALILKEWGTPGTRYAEFYEIRRQPLPNWTTHLVLAGLMYLAPPLIAEKTLACLYVVGFAAAARYFFGAFSPSRRELALLALLLIFPRCWWMGFYNYCLSTVLYWFILGYLLRRRQDFDSWSAMVLCLLRLVCFFTHLLGFLLTAGSALWLAAAVAKRRLRTIAWVVVALFPAGNFAYAYFQQTGFFADGGAGLWAPPWRDGSEASAWPERFELTLTELQAQFFPLPVQTSVPVGILVCLLGAAFIGISWAERGETCRENTVAVWPLAFLGVGIAVLYFMVSDHLGAHGGFIKSRLALLPPLLWLSCCRPSSNSAIRIGLVTSVAAVATLNLILVIWHVHHANRELAEFTAGIEQVGQNQIIFPMRADRHGGYPDHLAHAADYYALRGGNINLDNHQADARHFPVRFRPGIERGWGSFAAYRNRSTVDLIIAWRAQSSVPTDFQEVFHHDMLTIWKRMPK